MVTQGGLPYPDGMVLYVARHGQTDWNLRGRWQSRSDVPLNATGRGQAEALKRTLQRRQVEFTRALSSPLTRAMDTAQILLSSSEIEPEIEPTLAELDLGDYEGRYESDLKASMGGRYDEWRSSLMRVAPPGGESMADVVTRVTPLVECLQSTKGVVLLVGHQYVNMALKAKLSGCFSTECLQAYKQANDEIDIWSLDPPGFMSRMAVG